MSVMSGSVEALSTETGNEPTEKTMPAKIRLKGYRQKLMTIKARIKYREHAIKGFRKHLKNGTFPQRMKSIKPYPKMTSPEAQAIVNAACDQVQSVIFDQMIQEEEKKTLSRSRQLSSVQGSTSRSSRPLKNPRNLLWLNFSKNSRTCSQNIPNFVVN